MSPGPTSLILPVHLKSTDTMVEVGADALGDTGATGDVIDEDYVKECNLPTRNLSQPIPVFNVDGSPNEAGLISKVVDVLMTYQTHSERILLAVTKLGKQKVILGYTWFKKHNPDIDFTTGTVKMT
ncbi:hypothetical protein GALMADRAFT_67019, partial [Galerina marginata CBS 339.88]